MYWSAKPSIHTRFDKSSQLPLISFQEQVERWQDREGSRQSALRLSLEVVKKDDWYPELLRALRKTGNSKLANAIEGKQSDSVGTGPGLSDDEDDEDGKPGTYRGATARKTHSLNKKNFSPSGSAACTSDMSSSTTGNQMVLKS